MAKKATKSGKKNGHRINAAEFVKVWTAAVKSGKTINDVATHFDSTAIKVRSKFYAFRKAGVKDLKSFPHSGRKLDYAELNKLARA